MANRLVGLQMLAIHGLMQELCHSPLWNTEMTKNIGPIGFQLTGYRKAFQVNTEIGFIPC